MGLRKRSTKIFADYVKENIDTKKYKKTIFLGPLGVLTLIGEYTSVTNKKWKKPKKKLRNHCYKTSFKLCTKNRKYKYYEGLCYCDELNQVFRHSWVVDEDGNIKDITYKPKSNTAHYLGLQIKFSVVKKLFKQQKKFGCFIPDSRDWVEVEKALQEGKII